MHNYVIVVHPPSPFPTPTILWMKLAHNVSQIHMGQSYNGLVHERLIGVYSHLSPYAQKRFVLHLTGRGTNFKANGHIENQCSKN